MKERLEVLTLIESGEISVAEGVRRLERLTTGGEEDGWEVEDEVAQQTARTSADRRSWSGRPELVSVVWKVVFGGGIAVLALGGWLLAGVYAREGPQGMVWGWLAFSLGLAGMALGWWLRSCRWFYLRVRERDGTRFTLALPLPLELGLWIVRLAKPFVGQLREMEADELIVALRDELRRGQACVVSVDDEGDKVEMFFG